MGTVLVQFSCTVLGSTGQGMISAVRFRKMPGMQASRILGYNSGGHALHRTGRVGVMMELITVDSSSVRGVGYDENRKILYLQYIDGEMYQYFKVPKSDFIDLLSAKSIGRFVNKRIKPYYNYKKLKEAF
jgi:hypothetical protein